MNLKEIKLEEVTIEECARYAEEDPIDQNFFEMKFGGSKTNHSEELIVVSFIRL